MPAGYSSEAAAGGQAAATPATPGLPFVKRPALRPNKLVLSFLLLERGHSRLQLVDGLVLALRLIRQLPEELQDLADEVLRPSAGVQWLISVVDDRD